MSPEPYEGWFPTFRALPRAILLLPLRIWRKTWRFSLTVLILLVIAHTIFNFIAGRKLEAELRRIRQAGEPLTLAEAAPPQIPDSENAAVPYQKAFAQFQGHKADLDKLEYFLAPADKKAPKVTLAEAAALVDRYQEVFRFLQEGAKRPACRFPVNWEAGFNFRLPHLAEVRRAVRLLTTKALVDSARGDGEQTMTDIAIIIRLANHIAPEPNLISQLVRMACIAIIFQQFPAIMEAAPPDITQSRALYDLLTTAADRAPFEHAMEGERCCGLSVFDLLRSKKGGEFLASFIGSGGDPNAPHEFKSIELLWPIIRPIWSPFLKLDELYYLKHMQKQIILVAQPYRKSYKQDKALEERPLLYAIVSAMTLPVYSRANEKQDQLIAEIEVMRGALALRAYQIEHGKYPDSLAQLRAAGGWEIPADPFSGKDLIYRRQGNGYILYSVGPNFKDDGGLNWQEAIQKTRPKLPPYPNFDIPLKMTR